MDNCILKYAKFQWKWWGWQPSQKLIKGLPNSGMMQEEGIIEFICEGGHGQEATVSVELRTSFPGIGGTIITSQGANTANRQEYNSQPGSGHRMFLRHMILKKQEDYFYRNNIYDYAHIPRPIGSISGSGIGSCLYEWVSGKEGFAWGTGDYVALIDEMQGIFLD
jgi:hypothetical protein